MRIQDISLKKVGLKHNYSKKNRMTTEMNSDLGDETSNMLQTKNLSLTSSNSEPAYNGIPSISIICRIKPSKVPDKDEIRVSKPKHSKSTSRGLTN